MVSKKLKTKNNLPINCETKVKTLRIGTGTNSILDYRMLYISVNTQHLHQ